MTQPTPHQEKSDNSLFMTHQSDAGRLLLVRHGEQVWPGPKASIGAWVDPPLSDLGHNQAAATGDFLANQPVRAIYSSNLQRAHDTARAISAAHGKDVQTLDDLAEVRMFSELPQHLSTDEALGPGEFQKMHLNFGVTQKWDAYLHGERSHDFRLRVATAFEEIVAQHHSETVVVVCHGGVINAYLSNLLKLEGDNFFRPIHCSVSSARFDLTSTTIDTLNEHTFLLEAGLVNSGKPTWEE